jgi:RNA polymerase sigma-70 factor (ECF subfamily)
MSEMMSDDASDVSAASAGDPEAFARLYRRHAPVVMALCRACSSMAEAEDATQEVFLRAMRRLDQLENPAGLRPWLYAIARRVCAERRRSNQRRNRHETQAIMQRVEDAPMSSSVPEQVERGEQLDRLTLALDALPEEERLAIHLYYLEPDPVTAGFEALGVSRSHFYRLVHRGRERLASLMREASIR